MAKSFAELVTDVYTITKREDLVNETAMAIRAATLKAHQKDFYYKDLTELVVSFTDEAYLQSFESAATIARFRSLSYIRKIELDDTPSNFLTLIEPSKIFDNANVQKQDVYYAAGRLINIKSSSKIQKIIVGCYVHPIVLTGSFASWIADEYPFAIIYDAAATIFKTVGQDEQEVSFRRLCAEQHELIKIGNTVVESC